MLRIAIPNKGALSERAMSLLQEAGYSCRRNDSALQIRDSEHAVDFFFLRPRDIAVYVGGGVLDLGITGRDLALDSQAQVEELMPLGFGASSFYYAARNDSALTPDTLGGVRIATSYPNIVLADLARRGLQAQVIRLDGAVEISVQLGVADVIADVVQTGRTLVQQGLQTIGDPIMRSEAVLIGRGADMTERREVQVLMDRIQGILVAGRYVVVEYDVPRDLLEQACAITPGFESPTIAPLNKEGWVAVKAMVVRKEMNRVIDGLKSVGAKGIIVTDIRTCRL